MTLKTTPASSCVFFTFDIRIYYFPHPVLGRHQTWFSGARAVLCQPHGCLAVLCHVELCDALWQWGELRLCKHTSIKPKYVTGGQFEEKLFQLSLVLCNQDFFIQGSFNLTKCRTCIMNHSWWMIFQDRFHYAVLKAAISSHNILNLGSYWCLKYIFSFSSDSWSFGWYPVSTRMINFDTWASYFLLLCCGELIQSSFHLLTQAQLEVPKLARPIAEQANIIKELSHYYLRADNWQYNAV